MDEIRRRYIPRVAKVGRSWRSNSRDLAAEYGVTEQYIRMLCSSRRVDPKEVAERIWSQITRTPEGCWEFQGSRLPGGYGVARNGATVLCHRVAFEAANGPIPDGMVVRHTCDNPPCCNPDHLELGTQSENILDMFERGRANPFGHWAEK